MVEDGPPAASGIRGDADIGVAVPVLAPAGGAVAGLHHIPGLGAHRPDGGVCVVVLDLSQEPVGEHLPVRMVLCGGGLIGVGGEDLPAQLVVHGGLQDHRHVLHRAVVVLVIQSHAVGEMGGVREAQLLQLRVHQLHEGLLGAGDIGGQPQGRIGAGGEDGAVEQLPDGDGLIHHQAHHAAAVDVAVVGDVDGHGEGVVQVRLCDLLGGHQHRQDLGHGGRGDHGVGVLLRQDDAALRIQQHSASAGKGVRQLHSVFVGSGSRIVGGPQGLRRQLKDAAGLDRRFLCRAGQAETADDQPCRGEAGHENAQLPSPPGALLSTAGFRPLPPAGGPLLRTDDGCVLLVHGDAPV